MKMWRKPFDIEEKSTPSGHVHINHETCKGCGFCVEFCPQHRLEMSKQFNARGYLIAQAIEDVKCLACGFCEAICPEFSVKVSINRDQDDSITSSERNK